MPICLPQVARRAQARALLIACALLQIAAADETRYAAERKALGAEIQRAAAQTAYATGRARFSARVMKAMDAVPRHRFVPTGSVANAYENRPLAIGHGQTISQPYIVALMTELLEPKSGDVMLEVGTGSGYQAAVLSRLVTRVQTIEIIAPLADSATARLRELGYDNVQVKSGDGYYGWPDHAPYDGIIVTAAANSIPPPLIAQLKPGGRMVIPVGAPFHTQDLILLRKDPDGKVTTTSVLPVAFVPLTGSR
ncbi:MAG: protein-L-isoaspartate(D-aspartate) O-methyltransferase [Steroidobacteraceae bacterium]